MTILIITINNLWSLYNILRLLRASNRLLHARQRVIVGGSVTREDYILKRPSTKN
jgi:hypothetical protein